jgi:hypothetical protein
MEYLHEHRVVHGDLRGVRLRYVTFAKTEFECLA